MGLGLRPRRTRRDAIDAVWPDAIRLFADKVALGNQWTRSYAVVAYPRAVGPGWFHPLLRFSGPMTLSFYTAPLENSSVLGQLHRRLVWNRGIQEAYRARGGLGRAGEGTAIEDAERLRDGLARGDLRLLEVGLYVTIRAGSEEELNEASTLLESLASGMLMVLRRLRFQQTAGLARTLPIGSLPEKIREMDSQAWATLFPFSSEDIVHPRGQAWGLNQRNQSLVIVDRFQLAAPHSITIGWSGAGKSFAAKLEAIRSRYRGIAVTIVDPEGEYRSLESLGAKVWRLGEGGAVPLDPFELTEGGAEDVERQADFLVRFLRRLDADFVARYRERVELAIWHHTSRRTGFVPPGQSLLSADDIQVLLQDDEAVAGDRFQALVSRWRAVAPPGPPTPVPFEVFDFSGLSDRLKGAAYLAVSERIIRGMGGQRRLVILDEAWHLLNDEETSSYLEALFRRARKWGTALSLLTQDISDFTRYRAAEVCLRNAPTVLLLRQHPESLAEVSELLRLHEGATETVQYAGRGEGLLMVEDSQVALKIVASPAEIQVIDRTKRDGAPVSD
ncbi:MAG: conjugal transfer protein TraC [Thermaerobacter sp.]|nr:conjugal transfer protein TraC [Thermaerobacter sp.]